MTSPASSLKSDWIGIASASLCVVHCLLTPMLLALAVAYGWWPGLPYLFLILSCYAAYETSQHSVRSPWLWLIWLSFSVLTVAVLLEDDFPIMELASYLGSTGLILGHLFNIRHCKKHPSHKQNQRTARERPV